MPKLPTVSAKELISALKKLGYTIISQKGSHIKMRNFENKTVIIPNHRVLKKGTLKKGILNPLQISVDKLISLLK